MDWARALSTEAPLDASMSDAYLEEIADVVICLTRLADRVKCTVDGYTPTMQDAVNKKMAKNRRRSWALDGYGHGHHQDAAQTASEP